MTLCLTFATPIALDVRPHFMAAADARVDEASSSTDLIERRRAQWMAQAQAGDRLAYERVLADSVGLIRTVARRQGVQGAWVDDVVQETLLSVHRARHTYDPSRSYNAWLAALASRRAIDALRQQGRRDLRELPELEGMDYPDGADDAGEQVDQDSRARKLRQAIAELPDGQRQAVEAALKEQSLAETSALTGRSPSALKVSLHRALKVLRKRLNGGG